MYVYKYIYIYISKKRNKKLRRRAMGAAEKMNFSIKDFFSKCDQIFFQ